MGSVDFRDMKRDTLTIDLRSTCHSRIVNNATINVTSYPNPIIDSFASFDGTHPTLLVLPGTTYRISVPHSSVGNNPDPLISTQGPLGRLSVTSADLSARVSTTTITADTAYTIIPDTIRILPNGDTIFYGGDTSFTVTLDTVQTGVHAAIAFVYHDSMQIALQQVPQLCNATGEYLVNQGETFFARILITENFNYGGIHTSCPRDSGVLQIYDAVSGSGFTTVPFTGGTVLYPFIAGQPNVPDLAATHRYEKLLNLYVNDNSLTANYNAWMLIQGVRTLAPTFNTTPQLPIMVLHDPPGGASYSSIERDSSFSTNINVDFSSSDNTTTGTSVKVGHTINIPVFGIPIPGPYGQITINSTSGTGSDHNRSTTATFTASNTISTSSDPNYVGFNGDVFIGGAMNMKYAQGFRLQVDSICRPTVDSVFAYGIDSISTQFVFSVRELKGTILPNLYHLMTLAPDSGAHNKASFQDQINIWNKAISTDSAQQASANYTHNISFTSGTSYDYSQVADSNFSNSQSYTTTDDNAQSFIVGIGDGSLIDINGGVSFDFNTSSNRSHGGSTDRTTTYSYHLEDDVVGNYYSVDVGSDRKYGSPIFRIFAGASACPYEAGTQQRDAPTMVIDPLEIDNVPATAPASFIAYLHNQSESQETRTYAISLYPESNPNGAIVKAAGQNITQGTAYFTLGSGATLPIILTVEKGTFAADYTNLGVCFSSSCDSFIGITIPITARFQNTCSQVSILQPADGWLVNSSNHDSLLVGLAGYNVNNPSLKEIGLQYRTVGTTGTLSNWTVMNSTILDSANLQGHPIYEYEVFHTPNLNDGNYQIQAYAKCGSGINTVFTYSAPLNGVIDRNSFSLYGSPQPADGVLDISDNISLQFNQNIDCNQIYERYEVMLLRADSGTTIPATATCFGNGLVITTNPPSLLDSLDGVVLTATVDKVHGINGNEQGPPISWSFLVNRSKIYWSPANATLTTVQGSAGIVSATMLNVGPADSFTLVKVPSWLTLSQPGPYTLPLGTPSAPSQFHLPFTSSASLNQGHYADTVIAVAHGKRLNFFVALDVVTHAPNWSVNAANFSKNMNITANYSTTDSSAPLSTDRRDMIAVFVGDECRGVGYITYSGTALNKYAAYMTVYSNTTQGDTFTFRMWNALSGIEYLAKEKLPFLADASIGQIAAPYVLHAGGVFQTIPLASGWNWFSLDVTNNDMSPATLLKGIRLNDSLIVKSKDNYALYTRASGWTGSLIALNTANSYMININHADTLHISGQAITGNTIMRIATGWNWIGFPRHKIAVASDYINVINPGNNDLLKSQTQFMQYTSAWAGNLTYMYPGQGYRLRSGKDINQVVIPPDRALPNWTVESNLYQQNMTVTADLQINGASTNQSHYLVGAFVNGVCIGLAQPQYISQLNVYRLFITIHGDTANENQSITYKVYDTDNDVEYVPTYIPQMMTPDEVDGSLAAPYVINVETANGIHALNYLAGYNLQQNVPNPFARNTSITYTIPSEEQVTLTIYDESGRLVKELVSTRQEAGTHTVSFAQDNLQAGVYFYQLKAGEFVKTRRMLVLK
ncbi:MAG: hypothetical protein JWO03_1331 [Bacteroidetes bacterium]|nr:hypothetical protein [Bacteroidota bacterium]